MRARILIGITLILLVAVPAALSQAAAESLLLNQSSATATVKAGTALGKSLNKAGSQLGGQIQNIPQSNARSGSAVVVHRAQQAHLAQNRSPQPPVTKSASTGSMITSVQGGRVTRPSAPAATPKN